MLIPTNRHSDVSQILAVGCVRSEKTVNLDLSRAYKTKPSPFPFQFDTQWASATQETGGGRAPENKVRN
jgi:hypothetical protein